MRFFRCPVVAAIAAALAIVCAPSQAAGGDAAATQTDLQSGAGGTLRLTDDDLLLFAVTSDGTELTDSLPAYSSRGGLFLPLGELSRVLDLAIVVLPPEHRAEGWFLSEERKLTVDLDAHRA